MPANFNKYSNYPSNAGFYGVTFGSGADVLEVELNELQQIVQKRMRDLIVYTIGDGIYDPGSSPFSYSGGRIYLQNTWAFVAGYVIKITTLSCLIASGSVKLAVWEAEARGLNDTPSTLKLEGNEQESTTVSNTITDTRLGSDYTTRRRILKYTLIPVGDTVEGASYLTVASVSGGQVTVLCDYVKPAGDVTALANAALPAGTNGFGGFATAIPSGSLNNYTQDGFFAVASGVSNQPSGVAGGFLQVIGNSASAVMQMMTNLDGTRVFQRVYYNSAWTAWRYLRTEVYDPTDATRAPLASPALTGTPTAPTAASGTNTDQLATTAFTEARTRIVPSLTVSENTTFGASHAGRIIHVDSASELTMAVPLHASVPYPVGTAIVVSRVGKGAVNLSKADGSIVINSADGKTVARSLRSQGSMAAFIKRGNDVWQIIGDLTSI